VSRNPRFWIAAALLAATQLLAATPTATPATPAKAAAPAVKAAKPAEKLVSIAGTLDIVFSTSVFGPGTSIDPKTGALMGQLSSPGLAIDYNGKSLTILISRQTRLDDELKSGMVNTGATYKVTGHIREDKIIATSLIKIKDPDPPSSPPTATPAPSPAAAPSPAPVAAPAPSPAAQSPPVSSVPARPVPQGPLANALAGSRWQVSYVLPGAVPTESQWELQPSGTVVRHGRNGPASENDSWEVTGASLIVKINDAYAVYVTTELKERTMTGTATNKVGNQWTWRAEKK
jgi:hypothetical protein